MPRVAHIDHSVEPGGAELALRRLLEGDHGWDATVFVPPSPAGLGEFASLGRPTVQVVGVPQRAGALSASAAARLGMVTGAVAQSGALLLSQRFRGSDIVHANTSRAALIGLLATRGSRRRLVVHLRDALDEQVLGSLATRALQIALRRADGVVANSGYTYDTAQPWVRPDAHVVILASPTGHDGSRTPVPPRAEVRTVGILGRLAPWKGQAEVIRAFAAAFPGPDVRLQIAGSAAFGEETYAGDLERLVAELALTDRVDFLGQVQDIWPVLDGWDVCVHASTRPEPLGQSVLQYLAAARPTIAARAGGPREWIDDGETGVFAEPGDVLSLARAMRRMVDEPGLRERLHRTLVARHPVQPDADVVRAYTEFFTQVHELRTETS